MNYLDTIGGLLLMNMVLCTNNKRFLITNTKPFGLLLERRSIPDYQPLLRQERRLGMFKPNLELRRAVFEKMGWKWKSKDRGLPRWRGPDGEIFWDFFWYRLPPIETDWQECAKYLVAWMRERGFGYEVSLQSRFLWDCGTQAADEEIYNDNIARAACEAFMEVGNV